MLPLITPSQNWNENFRKNRRAKESILKAKTITMIYLNPLTPLLIKLQFNNLNLRISIFALLDYFSFK